MSLLPAIAEKAIKLYAGSHKISKVKELKENGLGAAQIARELNIGRASVYRALEN